MNDNTYDPLDPRNDDTYLGDHADLNGEAIAAVAYAMIIAVLTPIVGLMLYMLL
jgi:hypothetical protein